MPRWNTSTGVPMTPAASGWRERANALVEHAAKEKAAAKADADAWIVQVRARKAGAASVKGPEDEA